MPTIQERKASEGSHHLSPALERPGVTDLFRERLVAKFGTPLYLYDVDEIDRRVASLRDALPPSDLFFSFKSNPNPAVASVIREAGCRADLTSPGEIEAALAAGFDLSKALYGGPGK